jgi:hypothetical protein
MFPCGRFQFLNQGGRKNQLFHFQSDKKLVFSILAPYGRHKNGSFCDHQLDFFNVLLWKI